MDNAPTIDTALIPGIRQVYQIGRSIGAATTERFASERIPARSVIRSIYFAIDAPLREAQSVTLRLAFVDTTTPTSSDFIGTSIILPGGSPTGVVPFYSPDPIVSAIDHPYNFQLPDRQSRLITEVVSTLVIQVDYMIRLVIDGLGRIGL